MKNKLLVVAISSFLLFSFVTIQPNDDKKIKKKIIGTWSGSEEGNQIKGVTKYWIQERKKNGTFILMYTAITDCKAVNLVEIGKLWIKDGLFYEKTDTNNDPDVYEVKILEDGKIHFKAKVLTIEFDNEEYEFTETREE
ncbi:hypothetical protein [Flavobacterium sp.]|uniref:hypothetical protein n=1 Tax=Flavobacterium sp. TaxID=239 RepID=UPI0038FD35DB